jgi:hypothetical protein
MGRLDQLGDAVRGALRPMGVRDYVAAATEVDPQAVLMARHLLDYSDATPADWRRIDEFLRDHQVETRGYLGGGEERIALDAIGGRGEPYVLKVGGSRRLYDLPDTKGVIPYVASGSEGGINFGLQPKAKRVYVEGGWAPPGVPKSEQYWWWDNLAHDVQQSLHARGYHWGDASASNVGVMPDETIGVLDGAVTRWNDRFTPVDRAMSPEEAIRRLRLHGNYGD